MVTATGAAHAAVNTMTGMATGAGRFRVWANQSPALHAARQLHADGSDRTGIKKPSARLRNWQRPSAAKGTCSPRGAGSPSSLLLWRHLPETISALRILCHRDLNFPLLEILAIQPQESPRFFPNFSTGTGSPAWVFSTRSVASFHYLGYWASPPCTPQHVVSGPAVH